MKRLLMVLILAAYVIGTHATDPAFDDIKTDPGSIEGIVSDKLSGEKLTGVKVNIEGTDVVTYTDFDGKFSFHNLNPGEYTFQFDYISYYSEKYNTSVESSELKLEIELEQSKIEVSVNVN